MTLEVRIDEGLCMGAQRCVYLASDVFRLNDAGQAEIVGQRTAGEAELIEIARQCPNFAITVVSDGAILVGEE